jgi:nucleotide-binding universal stress UspA family protein
MGPQIKKILYATDLSKNSSYAFLYATDMARRYGATIVVLHAIDPLPAEVRFVSELEKIENKEREEMGPKIQARIQEFCKNVETKICLPCAELVSKILVPRGYAPEEILIGAEKEGCDVIILGTHGKGFLSQTFLGSVSNSVLQRTRKPVFIIPMPAEQAGFDLTGI